MLAQNRSRYMYVPSLPTLRMFPQTCSGTSKQGHLVTSNLSSIIIILFRGLNHIESIVWGKKSCPFLKSLSYCVLNRESPLLEIPLYTALQVTCQRLEAWLSCCGECHHGYASLNLVTAAPNLRETLNIIYLGGHNYKPSLFLFPISIDK